MVLTLDERCCETAYSISFPSTNVQNLTRRKALLLEDEKDALLQIARFTCFKSTKVQKLTGRKEVVL